MTEIETLRARVADLEAECKRLASNHLDAEERAAGNGVAKRLHDRVKSLEEELGSAHQILTRAVAYTQAHLDSPEWLPDAVKQLTLSAFAKWWAARGPADVLPPCKMCNGTGTISPDFAGNNIGVCPTCNGLPTFSSRWSIK